MKITKPTIYGTSVYKELVKQSKRLPKIRVSASITSSKADIDNAKTMEKLLNYQFKHNVGGIKTKYFILQKKLAELYMYEVMYGIKFRWQDFDKTIKSLTGNLWPYLLLVGGLEKWYETNKRT